MPGGLSLKTIAELVIMVVVIGLVLIGGQQGIAYGIESTKNYLSEKIFGLNINSGGDLMVAVKCAYYRCAEGCESRKIDDNCRKNFCRNVPDLLVNKKEGNNKFICDWGAEQYPVEFSLSTEREIDQVSLASATKPSCIYAYSSPSWTELMHTQPAGGCSDKSESSFTLPEGTYYADTSHVSYATNNIAPALSDAFFKFIHVSPLSSEYLLTYIHANNIVRKYILLSDSNEYQSNFDFNMALSYRISVKGVADGTISAANGKIAFKSSTSEEQSHPLKENDQYVFKFGGGYLIVATTKFTTTGTMTEGTFKMTVKTWLKYSPTNNFGCIEKTKTSTTPTTPTSKSCSNFAYRSECLSHNECVWGGITVNP